MNWNRNVITKDFLQVVLEKWKELKEMNNDERKLRFYIV